MCVGGQELEMMKRFPFERVRRRKKKKRNGGGGAMGKERRKQ